MCTKELNRQRSVKELGRQNNCGHRLLHSNHEKALHELEKVCFINRHVLPGDCREMAMLFFSPLNKDSQKSQQLKRDEAADALYIFLPDFSVEDSSWEILLAKKFCRKI